MFIFFIIENRKEIPSSAKPTIRRAKQNSELPIPPDVHPSLLTKNKRQIGEITTLPIRTSPRLNNTPSPVNNMQRVSTRGSRHTPTAAASLCSIASRNGVINRPYKSRLIAQSNTRDIYSTAARYSVLLGGR